MSNMLRGKFRDKIRNFFIKRNNGNNNSQSNYIKEETKTKKDTVTLNKSDINEESNLNIKYKCDKNKDTNKFNSVGYLKKESTVNLKNKETFNHNTSIKAVPSYNDDIHNIEILENRILNKVETIINNYKNKLEIISTDIYVLNNYINDNKTKEKCKEEQSQIENIMEKLYKIKEQYNILKSKNIELEYLGINNSLLIDDIYEYKKLVNNITDISKYQDKYKKLEVFIETSSLLDTIEESIKKLEKSNIEKMEKINLEEENFIKIKDKLFRYDSEFNKFSNFIESQNSIIEEMKNKVGKIDSYEETITKLIGYDRLLFNNLKYISLLLLSPLKGLFPVIVTSTLATKSTIDLLKDQVHIEESKKIVYTAEDYGNKIITNIFNVDDIDNLISVSIGDIKKIKEQFKQNKNLNSTLEYRNLMKKIESTETILMDNKNKLCQIKKKLNACKQINNDKLVKVRKLNES